MTSKEVLEKLRESKLLSIQDYDVIQPIDGQGGWGRTDDPRVLWRKEEHLRANKQLKKENTTLVGIRVEWPVDEVVSIVKFDPYSKKAQVFTGRTFDPHPFFEDFDNTKCRTKMAIKTDIPFKNRIGGHLVAFYGDLREEIRDFAELIGFGVTGEECINGSVTEMRSTCGMMNMSD